MDRLDYSPHYLAAKQNLTKIYELLNRRDFIPAATLIDETLVELRLMRNAVKTHTDQ